MFTRFLKWLVLFVFVALVLVVGLLINVGDVTGGRPGGERLARMERSAQYNSQTQSFDNALERVDGSFFKITYTFFFGGSDNRVPAQPLNTQNPKAVWLEKPRSDLRITWLGHSTFVIEIDGITVLVDPVWSERASPFSWAGPRRFYAPLVSIEALPKVDAVLISHDHYDHLDRHTIRRLSHLETDWIVPLGVGAHLEKWDVDRQKIHELDWWETHSIRTVRVTATPARHFSGRSILFDDQNATLWAGWAIRGREKRLFYSGDTGMHPEFKEIGKRLGPFDVTLMEIGAYSALWTDVHLGPEQAVLAHQLVKGKIMFPVHWGLFDLALHSWTEPAQRILEAAQRMNVQLGVLRPGGSYDSADVPVIERWWPELPWQTVDDNPVWSTGVDALLSPWHQASDNMNESSRRQGRSKNSR